MRLAYGGGELYTVCWGKPEGMKPLRRQTKRWENNINHYPANVENMVSL